LRKIKKIKEKRSLIPTENRTKFLFFTALPKSSKSSAERKCFKNKSHQKREKLISHSGTEENKWK